MEVASEAWTAWSPESRRQALQVRNPELVSLLRESLSALWAAEIRTRKVGVRGLTQPFDQTSLPLLSQVEFDGAPDADDKVFTLMKWPRSFHDDAATLLGALRRAFEPSGASAGRRCAPRLLPRQRWCQLLQPPAASWRDLERQLARLVEQVLLQAWAEERSCQRGPPPAAGAASEPLPDLGEPTVRGSTAAASTCSRVSKRQRQQERRRCKKAAESAGERARPDVTCSASAVADDRHNDQAPEGESACELRGEAAGTSAGASGGGIGEEEEEEVEEAPSVGASMVEPALGTGDLHKGTEEPEDAGFRGGRRTELDAGAPTDLQRIEPEIAADVLKSLRSQVEQLARELREKPGSAGARSAAAATLSTVGASAFPTVLGIALGAEGTVESPQIDTMSHSPGLPHSDSFHVGSQHAAPGRGQGRPIQSLQGAAWGCGKGHAKGMGRGRVLAPPPGLQGMERWKNPPAPHGLSQFWTSGWTIPEEERSALDRGSCVGPEEDADNEEPVHGAWSQEHITSDINISMEEADACVVASPRSSPSPAVPEFEQERSQVPSFLPTPAVSWTHTPSPPGTPQQGPWRPGAWPPPPGAGGARAAWPTPGAAQSPAYVTVPVAAAQLCPRCGQALALPVPDACGAGSGGWLAPAAAAPALDMRVPLVGVR